jgi:glycosyltransferase involved in cell wall biosynthesis
LNILISPSGKLYGSEQVLIDYLYYTRLKFSVFVSGNGLLYNELKRKFEKLDISVFENVRSLYFRIFFLCLTKKVTAVYVNEAGHSKYIFLLARFFKKVKFVIHVRLIEDTSLGRSPRSIRTNNITVFSVSRFISAKIPVKNTQLYDPYPFEKDETLIRTRRPEVLVVGIIGRLSVSKGIDTIIQLLELVSINNLTDKINFQFYGYITDDVDSFRSSKLKAFGNAGLNGFESEKEKIYNSIDCVLHASPVEPLGRIFLEAIDFNKPFIGIDNGGIGEIGSLLNLDKLLVDPGQDGTAQELLEKLILLHGSYDTFVNMVFSRKGLAKEIFSPEKYAAKIDSFLKKGSDS